MSKEFSGRDPWAEEKGVPLPKEPPQGAVVPVISLDRREAGPWAAMVMGDHQARCPGVVLAEVASQSATNPNWAYQPFVDESQRFIRGSGAAGPTTVKARARYPFVEPVQPDLKK